MSRVDAPWTDEQVERLRAWQEARHVHPFTCPGSGRTGGGVCPSRNLIPTPDGWVCACGAYRQAWAHDFMVDHGPGSDPVAALLARRAAEAETRSAPFTPDWRDPRQDIPDDHNDLPVDERCRLIAERTRLLHIYGQASWHGTVQIAGNRNALIVLRDAIDAAIEEGQAETGAMTSDGEGFGVEIEMIDAAWESPAWETRPLPYSDPAARGDPDPAWDVERLRHALRMANAGLVKRGVRPVADPTKREDQI